MDLLVSKGIYSGFKCFHEKDMEMVRHITHLLRRSPCSAVVHYIKKRVLGKALQ